MGGSVPKPEDAIDLGLSVKWAPWNVGADKPSDYGEYFAWGEVVPHKDAYGNYGSYDEDSYYWCQGAGNQIILKYIDDDGKTNLEKSDDAAVANWGGTWRMPTQAELAELSDSCEWKWTDNYNGSDNAGYEIRRNGYDAVLFLPAAGRRWYSNLDYEGSDGYYWSSELAPGYSSGARSLSFSSGYRIAHNNSRCYGFSVRAVCSPAE